MKHNLYPLLAGLLIAGLLLSYIFEDSLNALSTLVGMGVFILVSIVGFAFVLIAMWDSNYIGKNRDDKPNY